MKFSLFPFETKATEFLLERKVRGEEEGGGLERAETGEEKSRGEFWGEFWGEVLGVGQLKIQEPLISLKGFSFLDKTTDLLFEWEELENMTLDLLVGEFVMLEILCEMSFLGDELGDVETS